MYISAKVVAGLAKRNRTIVLDKKPLGDWMDGWMAGRVAGATVARQLFQGLKPPPTIFALS